MWDGAIAMAKYFEHNPKLHAGGKLRGKKVLEVGSGCGLLGLVLASLGCDVVLTDKADVVPLLEVNVHANAPSCARVDARDRGVGDDTAPVPAASVTGVADSSSDSTHRAATPSAHDRSDSDDGWGAVRACVFDWGVTDPGVLGGPFDYIFGSDIGQCCTVWGGTAEGEGARALCHRERAQANHLPWCVCCVSVVSALSVISGRCQCTRSSLFRF